MTPAEKEQVELSSIVVLYYSNMRTLPHLLRLSDNGLLRLLDDSLLILLSRNNLHLVIVPSGSALHAVLRLPLQQDLIQVKPASVVHQEVLHLHHRLVTNHIGDRLEVPPILSDGCTSLDKREKVRSGLRLDKLFKVDSQVVTGRESGG